MSRDQTATAGETNHRPLATDPQPLPHSHCPLIYWPLATAY